MINKAFEAAQGAFRWVDSRLHIAEVWEHTAGHHIPKKSASWFYVFGSATLLCLVVQLITGTLLAFAYVPSGAEAYTTLEYLTYEQPLGWLLRGIHYWGSNFMVTIMLIHMIQVYLFGAYKYPREITWVSGVLLMTITLGLAFTGQVMRFDEDAYWGIGIGAAIAGRSPGIGEQVVQLMLGGPIIGAETLSRFFSLHVFVLPGSILAILALHLRMVLVKGINEYPTPGVIVNRETYDMHYANILKKDGMPFAPYGIWKDLVAGGVVLMGIVFCALVFGPKGPLGPPDPLEIDTLPRPDFFFMWIFAIAALMPEYMETVALLVGPPLGILALMIIPFIDNTGEKHWSRRPVGVLSVIFLVLSFALLTLWGITSPWSPKMWGWSGLPIAKPYLENRTPLELQGALVLQQKQCRNCHAIDGSGGHRGPDLSDVGLRLTHPQLVRQVIQGGGNMPAYGKTLTPSEIDAVVAYMVSLRPEGVKPAEDTTLNPATLDKPAKNVPAADQAMAEGKNGNQG